MEVRFGDSGSHEVAGARQRRQAGTDSVVRVWMEEQQVRKIASKFSGKVSTKKKSRSRG